MNVKFRIQFHTAFLSRNYSLRTYSDTGEISLSFKVLRVINIWPRVQKWLLKITTFFLGVHIVLSRWWRYLPCPPHEVIWLIEGAAVRILNLGYRWRYVVSFKLQLLYPLGISPCTSLMEEGGTRWRSWLRHCATRKNVAGSISDDAALWPWVWLNI